MGRLRTIGFEIALMPSTGTVANRAEAIIISGANAAYDTSVFRTGEKSLKFTAGGSTLARSPVTFGGAGVANFFRVYFRFSTPTTGTITNRFCSYGNASLGFVGAALKKTSGGPYRLVLVDTAGTQIGAGESSDLAPDTWYRLEFKQIINAGADTIELRLDGATIQTSDGTTNYTDTVPSGVVYQSLTHADLWFDDMAANDDTGATQNSWPGEGNIVLLKPVADNARGANWLDGGGGTTNLFSAVDNTPPTGSGTPVNGSQIKNTAKDTTGNYDASLTDYTTAGVPSTATVTLVQPVFEVGASKVTTTGAEQFVSNPAGPAETSMDFYNGSAAAGTWPTGWRMDWLAAIEGDIAGANRSTQPVIRIGKRISSTNSAYCDFMGAYVEYIPAASTLDAASLDRPFGDFGARQLKQLIVQ